MHAVVAWLTARLAMHEAVTLTVQDPDTRPEAWPGERNEAGEPYRDWRVWLDLADGVAAHLATPRPDPDEPHALRLTFRARGGEADLHDPSRPHGERYAASSAFAQLDKTDHPGFLLPLLDAVRFAAPQPPDRVLIVGCFDGDELAALTHPPLAWSPTRMVGVDRDARALQRAMERFPVATFLHADLAQLEDRPLDVGRFDLILAIGVLNSPSLDGARTLAHLVRNHAHASGGVIVGLPASRLLDGAVVWGARTRNYRETDLSLVVRDLAGHRRYLHQHGYRTRITGRYDLLLTGRRDAPDDGA